MLINHASTVRILVYVLVSLCHIVCVCACLCSCRYICVCLCVGVCLCLCVCWCQNWCICLNVQKLEIIFRIYFLLIRCQKLFIWQIQKNEKLFEL